MGRQIKNLASVGVAVAAMAAFGLVLRAQDPQQVNTWRPVGPMAHAFPGAAVAALADGRTVIAGGQDADGSLRDSVLLLDPIANQIVEAGRLLERRAGHTATPLADGRVLIAGGQTAAGINADVEVFDPATGTSLLTAMLWEPRTNHAAAALRDGRVLIVGGSSQSGAALATAEIVETSTASVAPVESLLGVPRRHASASTLADGRVLVAGGNDGVQDLSSAELFVPAFNAFAPLDAANVMSAPRSRHTALLLPHNNGVLIAGGVSNGAAMASAEVFLPAEFPDPYSYGEGRFAATAPMATPRAHAISGPAGDNGYAFAAGGASDAEIYRFATIKTDKDDYAPGERAIITGSGWQPGENVRLVFQEDPAVHDDYVLTVTADNQGNIFWDQWAPEQHDLNVRFYLSAVDSQSRAQITFTDGQPESVSLDPPSRSLNPGGTATYTALVNMVGNERPCTVTMQVTAGLPAGATATFDGNATIDPGNVDFSRTLTIATTQGVTLPGTYTFTVRATRGTNCNGSGNGPTTTGTLVVNGASSSLAMAPATGTYGGTATLSATLTSGGLAVADKSIAFALNGTTVGSATTNASGVAVLSNVSLAGIGAGFYPNAVSASFVGDGAYLASTAQNSLTIAKAVATINVTGYTGVYDGDSHHATGTATGVNGEDLSSLLDVGESFTDVPGGTATWSFAGDDNYEPANGSATITISKAAAQVSVIGFSGPYDGFAHGATGSATGVNGEDLTILLDLGASYTDVPGGVATWTFAGNNNYDSDEGTVAIVLTKVNAVVNVAGFTGIYDGGPHGAIGSAEGVRRENLTGLLTLGATFTDVPGGTAHWTFAGDGNYLPQNGSVEIEISQADAIVSVEGYTGVYNGDPQSATGTAVGVQGEDLSGLLSLGGTFTDVPGGTANWVFAGNLNYKRAEGSVEIVIGKAEPIVSVNGYTGVYDGEPHGASGSAAGVKGENLSSLLNLGASFTNFPGGQATWTFAGNLNYNSATGVVEIVIEKANQVITWAAPAPIVFGTPLGSAQLNAVVTAGDGTLTYNPGTGSVLAVGTQTLKVYASGTNNYHPAMETVTLTVNPWHLTGFYNPVTMGGQSVLNTVKGGSTVPLKFNIYTSSGGTELTSVSDISGFYVYPMSCAAGSLDDPIEMTTTGSTSLRYDATGRQFIQNWQTPKGAGVCFQVTMKARDGSTISAYFKTK